MRNVFVAVFLAVLVFSGQSFAGERRGLERAFDRSEFQNPQLVDNYLKSSWKIFNSGIRALEIDSDQHVTIKLDLKGFTKDQVAVDVINNSIRINAKARMESRDESEGRVVTSVQEKSFLHSFPLPDGVVGDQMSLDSRDPHTLLLKFPKG